MKHGDLLPRSVTRTGQAQIIGDPPEAERHMRCPLQQSLCMNCGLVSHTT